MTIEPPFITRVSVTQVDAAHWRLDQPLRYWDGTDAITVPAGFVTDFASTPQIVWSIGMPASGIYDAAATLHDYLYECGGSIRTVQAPNGSWLYRQYTKADADLIFSRAMLMLGVGQPKRWLMYQAVRAFGRGSFAAPPAQDATGLPIGAA